MKNIKIIKVFYSVTLLFCFVSSISSQSIQVFEPWLKIKPLKSNLSDVRDLYGIGTYFNEKYLPSYLTDFGSVIITFSMGDCNNAKVKKYNVPEWTVEEVMYNFSKKHPDLKPLLKELGDYKIRKTGDVESDFEYFNDEKGIIIVYDTFDKEVIHIIVSPSKKQKQEFECKVLEKPCKDNTFNIS